MANVKTNKKALIEKAREDKPVKANYTFRLNEELYEKFKKQCEVAKVTPTSIIEAFIKDFTSQ